MCNHKILHRNENGYVVKCADCGHYTVAFGNIVMAKMEIEFNQFKNVILDLYNQNQCEQDPDCKSILFKSTENKMALIFSLNDLEKLIDLLQQAEVSLEVDKMLSKLNSER